MSQLYLHVRVNRGLNLPAMDANGTSDPYCVLKLGDQNYKTKVQKRTVNPVWNEEVLFSIESDSKDRLEIEVFDRDKISKDDIIGTVEIQILTIAGTNNRLNQEFDIKGHKKGKLDLELLISSRSQDWSLDPVFGVKISGLECKQEADIPDVLTDIKRVLMEKNGLETVGIFRLAPDAHESAMTKMKLNCHLNKALDGIGASTAANLIKTWFRDLPDPLLPHDGRAAGCTPSNTADDIASFIGETDEKHKKLLNWLLDLCVEISAKSDVNKMSPQNMAIVIVPNLYDQELEPVKAVMVSKNLCCFFEKAIDWKSKQ